jgi:uncharacterized protein (TIGR02118 family)
MNALIAYWSTPADTAAFDDDYDTRHLPIVKAWPAVQAVEVLRRSAVIAAGDGLTAPYVTLIARFGSAADVEAVLAGPVAAAAADAERIARTHGVQVTLVAACA